MWCPWALLGSRLRIAFFISFSKNVTVDRYLSVFLIKTLGSLLEFGTTVHCFAKNSLKISAFSENQ